MAMNHLELVIFVLSSAVLGAWAQHYVDESSLQSALLSNYNTNVRPHTSTYVYVTMVPLSLNSLDISQQQMSFTAIYVISWQDDRLAWNSSNYGGITDFVVPPEQVWIPSIVVENAVTRVGRIGGENTDNTPLRIQSGGVVRWFPPLESTTSCEMKIANFPFDVQTCYITLAGWALSTKEMVLMGMPVNLTYYSANAEWELLDYWITKGTYFDQFDHFQQLHLHFSFRRKWQFYSQNLILPIILTSMLICCAFALHIDSGEKMGYTLTVLLSYVVFLTWVTDILPSVSNDTSILQVYLACVLCLGILVTMLTCWVVHLHFRPSTYPMSPPCESSSHVSSFH